MESFLGDDAGDASLDAISGIGATADKLCMDAAEAVEVLDEDCGCFVRMSGNVVFEFFEKIPLLLLL
jgi:hypothetical protein